jgi:hypothetical protein
MSYAVTATVITRLKGLENDVDEDLLSMAAAAADQIIDTKVVGLSASPATSIIEAANYYASMDILDALYDSTEGRSKTAEMYEARADRIIEKYLQENPDSRPGGGYGTVDRDVDWYDTRQESGYTSGYGKKGEL